MGYTYSFADNGTYSAEDVNLITKRFVSAGIEDPFTDGVPYNLSKFNEVGTLLYTSGIVPESVSTLRVSVDGSEILIAPGTAFFDDGAVITVDAGGHSLSRIEGAVNYVYLKNDLIASNTCYPEVSVKEPSGIYVMLAEIGADGTVTDRRTYAMGKLPGYASNANHNMVIEDEVLFQNEKAEDKSYAIGNNTYRMALVYHTRPRYENQMADSVISIYHFDSGTYLSISFHDGDGGASDNHFEFYRQNKAYAAATITLTENSGIRYMNLSFEWHHGWYFENPPSTAIPFKIYLF